MTTKHWPAGKNEPVGYVRCSKGGVHPADMDCEEMQPRGACSAHRAPGGSDSTLQAIVQHLGDSRERPALNEKEKEGKCQSSTEG